MLKMANKKLPNITFQNAEIVFRNFAGKKGTFNPDGKRNFCILLDRDHAADMKLEGWNVKYLKPRDDGDTEQPYLPVEVRFDNVPPNIFMVTSRGQNRLNSDTVNELDWADIAQADLTITPYVWEFNGKSGVKAYLKTMYVTVQEDELDLIYSNCPDSAQNMVGGCGNCEACDGSCSHCDD